MRDETSTILFGEEIKYFYSFIVCVITVRFQKSAKCT